MIPTVLFFGGFTSPTSEIEMPMTRFAGGGGNYKHKWQESSSRLGPGGLFGSFMGSNEDQNAGNLEFKTLVKDYVQAAFGDSESTTTAPLSVSNVQNKIQSAVTELETLYKLDAAYMSYYRGVYDYWKDTDCPRVIAQVPERISYSLEKWKEYNMAHTLLAAPFDLDHKDQVKITNPNESALVYYTIDGSDPMGKDGVKSPSALEYSADKAIELTSGKHLLVSRAFTPNNWGPLSKAEVDGATLSRPNVNEELLNTEAQNVLIYPNPARFEINIDLKNNESLDSKMSIYTVDGKLVKNTILPLQSNKVSILDLSVGYYIIKIVYKNGKVSTHKLIKN